jgi:hypothetical protein
MLSRMLALLDGHRLSNTGILLMTRNDFRELFILLESFFREQAKHVPYFYRRGEQFTRSQL